jgi:hypothetical protein
LANAARPRRVRAFVVVAVICGVLVRLNCVPSTATSRHPRQNASGCRRVARGRKTRRINSAKISQGSRARRSAHELSANEASNNSEKCSANVPARCMT